jgi:hypothetical protein
MYSSGHQPFLGQDDFLSQNASRDLSLSSLAMRVVQYAIGPIHYHCILATLELPCRVVLLRPVLKYNFKMITLVIDHLLYYLKGTAE